MVASAAKQGPTATKRKTATVARMMLPIADA